MNTYPRKNLDFKVKADFQNSFNTTIMQEIPYENRSRGAINLSEGKINQLIAEVNTWKRLLDFSREENVQLKIRLSEILKGKSDGNLLDELENFQSKFIRHDELINLLKKEIAALDQLLGSLDMDDRHIINLAGRKLTSLRNTIAEIEGLFFKLQFDFNAYLAVNM